MLVLDLIVSGFAAWGLFCAMKFFSDGFMTPKNARPRPTVRISGQENIKDIAALCENARKAIICNRGEIMLLLPEEGEEAQRLRCELDALGLRDVHLVYEKERQNEQ